MNDIAKKATADRFLDAIEKEGLSKSEAGTNIGLAPAQVSYLFNEKYWSRLGNTGWDRVLAWVNSGYSLVEFPKHREVKISVTEDNRIMLSDIKSNISVKEQNKAKKTTTALEEKYSVNLAEIGWILGLHKKGKSVEQISKELKIYIEIVKRIIGNKTIEAKEEEKTSDLNFIQLLKEERARIAPQIDAIDVLLKHYIS